VYNFSTWDTIGSGTTVESKYDRLDYKHDPFNFWDLSPEGILTFGGKKDFREGEGYLAALGIHSRYTAWNAVRDRMISGSGIGSRAGYYGQSVCPCELDDCTCSIRNTWVNYVRRDGSPYSRNWKLAMNGAQAGTDIIKTMQGQAGLFFGYEEGKTTHADERVDADDLYFGVYAAYVLRSGADIRGVFAYGWQDYEMERLHDNNSDYTYYSSFTGNTVETSIEIGKRISDGTWSMRPVIAVDVMNNSLKEAMEYLQVNNDTDVFFTYFKTDLTQVFVRLGSDAQYQSGNFIFNGGLYYSYDLNGSRPNVHGSKLYLDVTDPFSRTGSKLGRSLLNFNATGSWQLARGFTLIGGYQGEYALDGGNNTVHHTSHAGGMWKW